MNLPHLVNTTATINIFCMSNITWINFDITYYYLLFSCIVFRYFPLVSLTMNMYLKWLSTLRFVALYILVEWWQSKRLIRRLRLPRNMWFSARKNVSFEESQSESLCRSLCVLAHLVRGAICRNDSHILGGFASYFISKYRIKLSIKGYDSF